MAYHFARVSAGNLTFLMSYGFGSILPLSETLIVGLAVMAGIIAATGIDPPTDTDKKNNETFYLD